MTRRLLAAGLLLLGSVTLAHEGHEMPEGDQIIRVQSVVGGSAADQAGLQAGDTFLAIDDRPLNRYDDLKAIMGGHRPGDTVSLKIRRNDATMELPLKFGERPDGGVSIGVSLELEMRAGAEPTEGTTSCLAWIDETYRLDSTIRELGLDLADAVEPLRECVTRDTQRMASADAIRYCDNVFKVHCSGIDLVTEIAEAQVERCESVLAGSLGRDALQSRSWKVCGQQAIFDRYSKNGLSSDDAACRAAYRAECGT